MQISGASLIGRRSAAGAAGFQAIHYSPDDHAAFERELAGLGFDTKAAVSE